MVKVLLHTYIAKSYTYNTIKSQKNSGLIITNIVVIIGLNHGEIHRNP